MRPKGTTFGFWAAVGGVGLTLMGFNSEAMWCDHAPWDTGSMRAPDGCFVEPSTLAVVLGNIGGWMFLIGMGGVVVAAIIVVRAELRR